MSAPTVPYLSQCNNIGQVKEDDANEEIKRLEKQTAKKWFKDYSEILMPYTQHLSEGHCWIISDDNPTLTIRLSILAN